VRRRAHGGVDCGLFELAARAGLRSMHWVDLRPNAVRRCHVWSGKRSERGKGQRLTCIHLVKYSVRRQFSFSIKKVAPRFF
jgi:hypothetical protein